MTEVVTGSAEQTVCKAVESVAEVIQHTQLQVAHHFLCPIYLIERPDFLDAVTLASNDALEIAQKTQPLNEIYPVVMSGDFSNDLRVRAFTEFVGATAWNILSEQGYAMQDKGIAFSEMWSQEHYKHSAMEQHIHKNGVQIVGFYFLETPENCSRAVFHDPRAGKVQIDLPEQDANTATIASSMVNFEPKPGLLIFSNAWLAHSFTRHASEQPLKFVHFNLSVVSAPTSPALAEVI
jgi:uncharacterized protein (TIGR02466 family)